jgi:hypothetical protein
VAEGQHSNRRGRPPGSAVADPGPQPFRLEHLWLVDGDGGATVPIAAMTFGQDGIGVIEHAGSHPRILPWSSVVAHAVEPWSGASVPEWWVDPELNRTGAGNGSVPWAVDPTATSRPRAPATVAGTRIVVQTTSAVHRFFLPDGDARALSGRVGAFALRYGGPSTSAATRVVSWGQDVERRKTPRPPAKPPSWPRVRPYLVVAVVLVVVAAIVLILLQSAGTIHLPLLGGSTSGTGPPVRAP